MPPSSSKMAHDDVSDVQNAQGDISVTQDAQDDDSVAQDAHDAQELSSGADQDLGSVSDQDHRPSDYVFDFVSPVVVRDPIGRLVKMLENTADPVHQKNLRATIAIMRAGGEILDGQIIADGKLIRFEDWKPEMGPFYTPAVNLHSILQL
ncbi:hypothetical protein K440DRAFT_81019 [Wilcoxina mikolae CBS 423.85]|nr:hypothetical protein K440DRAFT_81019 [Wilcoxina mikolae CBS 423.85]